MVEAAAKATINCLTSFHMLATPDFNKPFLLTRSASDAAVGAMVSQQTDNIKASDCCMLLIPLHTEEAEVSYTRAGTMYGVVRCEGCRHFMYGRQFTASTDPLSLMHLARIFDDFNNARVVRWLGHFMQYELIVKCINGITSWVADVLSHRLMSSPTSASTVSVCVDSRFLSKLRSPFVLYIEAIAIFTQRNTGRHV